MRGVANDGHHLVQMIHDDGRSLASGDDPARAADKAISCCTCAPRATSGQAGGHRAAADRVRAMTGAPELLDQRADTGTFVNRTITRYG